MIDKSYVTVLTGLLLIIVLSAMLYSGMRSPVLHVLLVIGFITVGVGISLGFIKMVSDEKE